MLHLALEKGEGRSCDNDLSDSVTDSIVSIFADDTRVTKVIKEAADIEKLQNDIVKVYEWQKKQ